MLGKDYTASYVIPWFLLTRHPVRIVTTSAKDDHLRVLWGELGERLRTSALGLTVERGGILQVNHQDIRKLVRPDWSRGTPWEGGEGVMEPPDRERGGRRTRNGSLVGSRSGFASTGKLVRCPLSYCVGMVASKDSIASMQGHHIANTGDGIPRTLFIADECSSVPNSYYKMASTWANRILAIGNTWPTDGETGGWWQEACEGGDVPVAPNHVVGRVA